MYRAFLQVAIISLTALSTVLGKSDKITNLNEFNEAGSSIQVEDESENSQLKGKFKNTKPNPEELGVYFEGDIHNPAVMLKNGLLNTNSHWKSGIVPVEVRGDFDPKELVVINTAIEMYHNLTCIQFIQHSAEKDFVTITKNPTGCWSSLGRIGGKQILNLQSPMCLIKVGTVIHELMHVLGFNHEHTREDRDEYVEINWQNIPVNSYGNFGKSSPNTTNTFEVKYDYESVLHYSPFAFAMDSFKPTLVPKKQSSSSKMGQRDGLSKSDIVKIWKMYQCKITTAILNNDIKTTRLKKIP